MEARAGKVNKQQYAIGFVELTSMVSELMTVFERLQADEWVDHEQLTSDWISPSAQTRVVRHGSSASLHSVLNQTPDAISAEFEVIHNGLRAFSWCEYLWPHLQNSDTCPDRSGLVELPATCLYELMAFHQEHGTSWLRRYRSSMAEDLPWSNRRMKIDKIGIVAQPDWLQIR